MLLSDSKTFLQSVTVTIKNDVSSTVTICRLQFEKSLGLNGLFCLNGQLFFKDNFSGTFYLLVVVYDGHIQY